MDVLSFIKQGLAVLDGGFGTCLQEKGLKAGEFSESWNLTHPDIVCDIHKAYFDAGANIVCANTFGANSLHYDDKTLEEIIKSALASVRKAAQNSCGKQEKFAAIDIGPLGKLLKPYGDLDFEDAVSIFAKTVKLGAKYGADLVFIETMNDSYETKAALLAAKENCDLPVFVSNAYGEDGKLMTGAAPAAMVALLEGMGADAIGANCSLGPKALLPVVKELLENASVPVFFKPNAGLPKSENGKTVYDVLPDDFASEIATAVKMGVRIVGGCCGTTPEYIKAVVEKTKNLPLKDVTEKNLTVISSYTSAVKFGKDPVLIGERINPTGKKRLKKALLENDMDYILKEGISEQERGVHALDVNVGLPEIDEADMLTRAVSELQAVSNLPLQIDTSNPAAMERALRIYNGKALINSVNGKEESMAAVFPLAKKYGGVCVALTLDENGIPETAAGRLEIAKKILKTAKEYGIDKKDIVFDPLAMTVSVDKNAARVTLDTVRAIKETLGCNVSLGVSNVSFGLPDRDTVNAAFFALALENGLSAAIMNPYSYDMMKTYFAFRALKGLDENCSDFIDFCARFPRETAETKQTEIKPQAAAGEGAAADSELKEAIIKGLKEQAAKVTASLLESQNPLDIINGEIIPALDVVGKGFEEKRVFLPQLLMSAESAKYAFEEIKKRASNENGTATHCKFVIATVKGDIHDIGKNIVKLLLENYGFAVTDLGRDVAPEAIVEETVKLHAPIVGLSALMTTTVPAMEETIKQLRVSAPWCKIVVGGAVMNEEYASAIGADKYCKDAMETVRYALDTRP